MKIALGFSSCPNDTFMFDALVNQKIDTQGFEFEIKIADVEELNQLAMKNELDVTKLSYFAYSKVFEQYQWLTSGSALGRNNGPLLISKKKIYPDEVHDLKIAIPGENTTANLLLSIAYPNAKNKHIYLFSDIDEALLSNEVDAGLIIHETRFTFERKGLKKIVDLGEFWEKETGFPIPLGGIVVKRDLNNDVKLQLNKLLKESVNYAFKHPEDTYPYVKKYAQELEDNVIRQHIDLYVNQFSVDIGEEGKNAVSELFKRASDLNIINKIDMPIFVA